MRPHISVCITHYNRPEKLGATLASLAAQTRVPDEVFVWDDCSRKDPTAVAREWQNRFTHFVYHRNPTNLGMPGNLNAVIAQATGDLVANLHDADVYAPTLLEKWASALENHPEAVLAFCRDSRWDNPRFVRDWTPEPAPITPGPVFFEKFYLGRIDSLIWGTVMMRRSIYQKILPFEPQYKNWADVDMWIRACAHGSIAYIPDKLIELDNSPAKHREFSFQQKRTIYNIIQKGIKTSLAENKREIAQRIHTKKWMNCWSMWMLGGMRRFDLKRTCEGLRNFKP